MLLRCVRYFSVFVYWFFAISFVIAFIKTVSPCCTSRQSDVPRSKICMLRGFHSPTTIMWNNSGWLGDVVVRESDFRSRIQWVWLPVRPLASNNSRQVVHTHVPLSPSSIIWYRPRGGDALWLGKLLLFRSGITPAMHHRCCGLSTYRLNGLGKGDEHEGHVTVFYWGTIMWNNRCTRCSSCYEDHWTSSEWSNFGHDEKPSSGCRWSSLCHVMRQTSSLLLFHV